jgi:hypothetical protein
MEKCHLEFSPSLSIIGFFPVSLLYLFIGFYHIQVLLRTYINSRFYIINDDHPARRKENLTGYMKIFLSDE